jgi:hypothetical protein
METITIICNDPKRPEANLYVQGVSWILSQLFNAGYPSISSASWIQRASLFPVLPEYTRYDGGSDAFLLCDDGI